MTTENNINFPSLFSPEIIRLLRPYEPIGSDLDGVKVNLAPLAVNRYNQLQGTAYTLEDLTDPWKMSEWYMKRHGCSQNEALEYTKAIWNSKECIEGAKPMDGAIELFDFLYFANLKHYFITSRPFSTFDSTQNWFKQNRNGIGFDRLLIQTSNEYNNTFKPDSVDAYGIKIFFEDMPEHALAIVKRTNAIVVLVNQVTNRDFMPNHPRIIRPTGRHTEGNILYSFAHLINHLQSKPF